MDLDEKQAKLNRDRAAQCVLLAADAPDPAERLSLFSLAKLYSELANTIESTAKLTRQLSEQSRDSDEGPDDSD